VNQEPGQPRAGAAASSGLSEAQRREGQEAQKRDLEDGDDRGEGTEQVKRRAKDDGDQNEMNVGQVRADETVEDLYWEEVIDKELEEKMTAEIKVEMRGQSRTRDFVQLVFVIEDPTHDSDDAGVIDE